MLFVTTSSFFVCLFIFVFIAPSFAENIELERRVSKITRLNSLRGKHIDDESYNQKIDEKTDFEVLCLTLDEYKISTKLKSIDLSGKKNENILCTLKLVFVCLSIVFLRKSNYSRSVYCFQ